MGNPLNITPIIPTSEEALEAQIEEAFTEKPPEPQPKAKARKSRADMPEPEYFPPSDDEGEDYTEQITEGVHKYVNPVCDRLGVSHVREKEVEKLSRAGGALIEAFPLPSVIDKMTPKKAALAIAAGAVGSIILARGWELFMKPRQAVNSAPIPDEVAQAPDGPEAPKGAPLYE